MTAEAAIALDAVLAAFLCIYILYCVFLAIHGIRGAAYSSFALAAACYLVAFAPRCRVLALAGLDPGLLAPVRPPALMLFAACIVWFIHAACEVAGDRRLLQALAGGWLAMALAAVVAPAQAARAEFLLAPVLWSLVCLAAAV